jgi:choline dehydrogenase-like flavoprotein
MSSVPYHSGVPIEAVSEPQLLKAAGIAPIGEFLAPGPHGEVTARRLAYLRTEALLVPEAVSETSAAGPTFWVHFWTDQWRPTHRIAIRCAQAGWGRDIHGMYRFGGWHFELPKANYPSGITMKFVLDGSAWMHGSDRTLAENSNHHFSADEVSFDPVPPRFIIPYDDFVLQPDKDEQDFVPTIVNEQIQYDVIIVGSGMGGGILADQLSDRGVRTLVLEAGGLTLPSHINNLAGDWENLPGKYQVLNFENKEGSEFLFGIQMGLGGRSVFWSGLIPRMREWEMTAWPSAVRSYLLGTGYDKAERLLRKRQTLGPFQNQLLADLAAHFSDYEFSDLPRSQHQPNLGPDGVIGNVLESPTGTFSTADLLLDSLGYGGRAGRENLTINLNHLVTQIESAGPEQAIAVCRDLAGNVERRYRAKHLILSAGSIESARIALRSNLANPNQTHQKIGRGLTDHPAYFTHPGTDYGYPVPRTLSDGSLHPYGDPTKPAKILMQHKNASATQHAFNVEILLNAWYWDLRHSDDDLRDQILQQQTQARVKFTFILQSPLDDNNWLALQGDDRRIALRVARNRPDKPFLNDCKQLRNQLLNFFQVQNPNPDHDIPYGNQGTPHHAGGSLRMSDDGTGVVDEDLRFEGYPNLYVCDVSVFPSIPCANPSLTLAALALMLADKLASDLGH